MTLTCIQFFRSLAFMLWVGSLGWFLLGQSILSMANPSHFKVRMFCSLVYSVGQLP